MGIAITVLVVIVIGLLLLQAGITFVTRIQFGTDMQETTDKARTLVAVIMTIAAVVMIAGIWLGSWLVTVGGVLGGLAFLSYGGTHRQDDDAYTARTRQHDAARGRPPTDTARPGNGIWVVEALLAIVAGVAYLFV